MRNAITLVTVGKKKEAYQQEKRLKTYAEMTGYNVVWQIRDLKSPADEEIIIVLNNLHYQDINVDVIFVLRYDHIHPRFVDTLSLIKNLSYYNVRIISVEETLNENDPIFKEVYYPVNPED